MFWDAWRRRQPTESLFESNALVVVRRPGVGDFARSIGTLTGGKQRNNTREVAGRTGQMWSLQLGSFSEAPGRLAYAGALAPAKAGRGRAPCTRRCMCALKATYMCGTPARHCGVAPPRARRALAFTVGVGFGSAIARGRAEGSDSLCAVCIKPRRDAQTCLPPFNYLMSPWPGSATPTL